MPGTSTIGQLHPALKPWQAQSSVGPQCIMTVKVPAQRWFTTTSSMGQIPCSWQAPTSFCSLQGGELGCTRPSKDLKRQTLSPGSRTARLYSSGCPASTTCWPGSPLRTHPPMPVRESWLFSPTSPRSSERMQGGRSYSQPRQVPVLVHGWRRWWKPLDSVVASTGTNVEIPGVHAKSC